jgi:predicted nucleotidyltransferase
VSDDASVQVDFMPRIHGIRSFESLRKHATEMTLGSARLRVASLEDILKSKRAANRPKDRAVIPVLEKTLREKNR